MPSQAQDGLISNGTTFFKQEKTLFDGKKNKTLDFNLNLGRVYPSFTCHICL